MQTVPAVMVHGFCVLQPKLKICSGSSYFSFLSLEKSTKLPVF